ncbi:FAD-binding and (Fe-S)-binding domain-containing protein [Halocatena halophila]|uniref:FAD-binding and (Fe-S)-binding domain-containing protein n=1 Tax=Halocatena halophila TaxID=2814576 RepID=UPI002ECFD9BA
MSSDQLADPAASGGFDYTSDAIAEPELCAVLDELIDGEVRFDTYSRQLYATDASAYADVPIGVVFPESTADVAAVMRYCAGESIPVLPRGGGTSLAGQAVNEAVVLDFTAAMDDVLEVDPATQTTTVQPGVILAELNDSLTAHGLKFAPDPAWGDKSTVGGAIGNNSTGSHSLVYGKTDAYIESCELVLADGSVAHFGEIDRTTLRERADPSSEELIERIYATVCDVIDEHAATIEQRYPDLKRNVSGYNLPALLGGDTVNLAQLLAGSEGTLGIVTEATVRLEPIPETKAVALLTYDSIGDAVADVAPILKHDPAAVEVMDDVLLGLAADTEEFADVVSLLPDDANAVLLVEWYANSDDDGKRQVNELLTDRLGPDSRASHALEAHEPARRQRFWKLRKSGLPILLSRTADEKHIAFIEDTAVPVENLPSFVAGVQEILNEFDTFASYYAHAGPGVLHIRPLVNTKTIDGIETMEAIADAITDLVVALDGSVSGEHGDGRARTQWNEKLYGETLWGAFRALKTGFDPDWLLNPGSVCGDVSMTESLRFDPEYAFDAGFEPALEWDCDNGFQGMSELCHGCGGCRGGQTTTGGVMCPTYRATDEEIQSTRGRANMLRAAMSGQLRPDEQFDQEFLSEVLDVCIGCKGCLRDCPSGVDMAKLKAEVKHADHQRNGVTVRDRLFGRIDDAFALASASAPLSNWLLNAPGSSWFAERVLDIAPQRSLPTFERKTFTDWMADREPAVSQENGIRSAVLVPDATVEHNEPAVGKAAVRVLEAAGVHVRVLPALESARPPLSKGLLDRAKSVAEDAVDRLTPLVDAGWDVVAIEPSDAVLFQHDLEDLLGSKHAEPVAQHSYGLCEYLNRFDLVAEMTISQSPETYVYHGHCHQKAIKKDHHAVAMLRRLGLTVEVIDSGCCGMAGSFGYEAEHYDLSVAIGSILHDQLASRDGSPIAPGTSCRAQIEHLTDEQPPHPIEIVAALLDTKIES